MMKHKDRRKIHGEMKVQGDHVPIRQIKGALKDAFLNHLYVFLNCLYVCLKHPHVFLKHLHVFLKHSHVFLKHSHVFLKHPHVFLKHPHVFLKHPHVFLKHLHVCLKHPHVFLKHNNAYHTLSFFPSSLLALILCLTHACSNPNELPVYSLRKSASSTKGMVVSAHPLASEVGLEILRAGGNAADAAIAVQFALAVVHPRAGNIGGGGFLVYRSSNGEITSLDYREKAPMASSRDMYLDSSGQVVPDLSLKGILAAGVPGTVDGLVETHQKHGRLQPWSRLVEPAIHLAKKGFRITAQEARRLNEFQSDFIKYNAVDFPFVKNKPWQTGDYIIQKKLASTLELIAQHGAEGFYTGINAAMLDSFCKTTGGLITKEDLINYQAIWRTPIRNDFRGYELYSMGLPSSGGIVLGQILHMIDSRLQDSLGYRHPYNIHLIVEAERRAYADRASFLGDPEFFDVPLDILLSEKYLTEKFSDFNPAQATESISLQADQFHMQIESFETTHISIADGEGNAAAVTTTLNDNYGCKIWVPGGGYFLNNEMDDFSSKPGAPNLYGLIGGEANAIAPGKRMLSSMTPTIIEKNGSLYMLLGTPGGSTIITSVLQVFLNKAVYGMDIDDAVQSLRFHHQWLPDEILYEQDAFSPDLESALKTYGHSLRTIEKLGMVEAIFVDETGTLHGAADHRGDDHASGW